MFENAEEGTVGKQNLPGTCPGIEVSVVQCTGTCLSSNFFRDTIGGSDHWERQDVHSHIGGRTVATASAYPPCIFKVDMHGAYL